MEDAVWAAARGVAEGVGAELADDQDCILGAGRLAEDFACPAAGPADFFWGTWATQPSDPWATRILVHISSFMLVGRHG